MLTIVGFVWAIGVLPQNNTTSRFTAAADLSPRIYGGTDTAGAGFVGGASFAVHPLAPILDDDSPPELQPFLQRVSSVELRAAGAYDRIRNVTTIVGTDAAATLAADFVIARYLVLGARAGWDDRRTEAVDLPPATGLSLEERHPLSFGLSVGARVGAVRFDLNWDTWGRRPGDYSEGKHLVSVRARGVADRRFDVTVELHSSSGGLFERGSFGAVLGGAWYPTRPVGLGVEVFAESASVWSGSENVTRAIGGALRASWWPTARVGLSLGYAATTETDASQTYVRHAMRLGVTFRLPGW